MAGSWRRLGEGCRLAGGLCRGEMKRSHLNVAVFTVKQEASSGGWLRSEMRNKVEGRESGKLISLRK